MTTLYLVKMFHRSFSKILSFAVCFLSLALSSSVLAQPFAYVTHEKSNDVWVIDTKTDEVVAKVEVGQRPRGVVISPDNSLVYIANGWARTEDERASARSTRPGRSGTRLPVGTNRGLVCEEPP